MRGALARPRGCRCGWITLNTAFPLTHGAARPTCSSHPFVPIRRRQNCLRRTQVRESSTTCCRYVARDRFLIRQFALAINISKAILFLKRPYYALAIHEGERGLSQSSFGKSYLVVVDRCNVSSAKLGLSGHDRYCKRNA